MRLFIRWSLCLLLLFPATWIVGSERPNILYLYVDDMGWGSIGPNGQFERKENGQSHLVTPNLDRLAREGVNFPRSYGAPVCSPARSSQQTGFHQGHTFADRNDPDNAKKAIRKEDRTMGGLLQGSGYSTAYWGKWGYGGSKDMANPTIDNLQTLPTSHGYEKVVAELHHVRAHTFFQPTLWADDPKGKGGLGLIKNSMAPFLDADSYPMLPARQNDPDYPETAYCDDVYCFSALDFVREKGQEYRNSGNPFFGLLAVQVPHSPFGEVEKLPEWNIDYRDRDFYKDLSAQSKQWAAMITRIDGHIGNLLKALEDPNHDGDQSDSVLDDTLIIFQSDNGGPGGKSRQEFDSNGGLKGSKGQVYEGGIRVPTLMRLPKKYYQSNGLKPGSDCDRVIDVTDMLPTFCDLAGIEAPVGIDGVSLAPTLTGKGEQRRRDYLVHETNKLKSLIEGPWKLVLGVKGGDTQLYNLDEDPDESEDVKQENSKRAKRMKKALLTERVDEPAGFANTYHEWTGGKDADFSKAENWSEYTYSNEGITYQKDDGSPRPSWIAKIENQEGVVDLSQSQSVLGLEVGSTLNLGKAAQLEARNELRIVSGGKVVMSKGSQIQSLRVKVRPGGVLVGAGQINGDLDLAGTVEITDTLTVEKDLYLGGELTINPKSGKAFDGMVLLKAARLLGDFDKVNLSIDGFELEKSETSVILRQSK